MNLIRTRVKIVLILAVILISSVISACGTSDTAGDETPTPSPTLSPTEKDPYSEKLDILFMPRQASSEKAALNEDDYTIKYLEEKYNLEFEIINTSSKEDPKSYGDILTTLIASGIVPDFMDMDVLGENSKEYEKLLKAGAVVNVEPYLTDNSERYPQLLNLIIEDASIEAFKTDEDKLFCLPHYSAPEDTVYLVRGDWVEKAGYKLEDINTLEKFSELMNAFVENDFDDMDTVGFSTSSEKYLYPIYAGYTGAYMFKEVEGYYTDWYTLYELRESLGYVYLMFKTQAFDRDYLSHDGAVPKEKITTGEAGCVATEIANLALLEAELKENIPDGYLEPLPVDMSGPAGTTRYTNKQNASANLISVYFEDPERILDMCEFIFSDDGMNLVSNGIEDTHYTLKDGTIVPDYEAYSLEGWKYKSDGTLEGVQTYNEIRNIITNINIIRTPEFPQSAVDWYSSLLGYTDILSNPFEDNGFSNSKIYASMTSVKDQWVDDFISGSKKLTDKNWEAFVEEYLTAGAQEQMDFYNSVID